MKVFVIFTIFIAIFSISNAKPQENSKSESQEEDEDDNDSSEEISDKIDRKVYSYNYEVNEIDDKLFFNKSERGDENGKVSGTFSVLRADGKLMTVEYYATKDDGFVPRIKITDKIDDDDDDDDDGAAAGGGEDENNSKEEKEVKNT